MCGHGLVEADCPRCTREAAWGIVTNRKPLEGHPKAIAWAGAYLDADRSLGVWVTLTPDEVEEVTDHARAVVGHARSIKVAMRWAEERESEVDLNARGFGAELAAAKATGLRWHKHLWVKGQRRKLPDLGRRTEVRNVASAGGQLRAFPPKGRKAGDPVEWCYLLVIGRLPTYRVVGWMEGSELIVRPRLRTLKAGWEASYYADQGELHPLPMPSDA
jgi:hypothetical protein